MIGSGTITLFRKLLAWLLLMTLLLAVARGSQRSWSKKTYTFNA
jgi:hypothetical protein